MCSRNRVHSMRGLLFAVALVAVGCVAGCRSSVESVESTVGGTIEGSIFLMDDPSHVQSDCSGTIVTCEGTRYSAITDSSGHWSISGLPSGSYNITATKQDYGSYRWYNQRVSTDRLRLDTVAFASVGGLEMQLISIHSYTTGIEVVGTGLHFAVNTSINILDTTPNAPLASAHLAVGPVSFANYTRFSFHDLDSLGLKVGQKFYATVAAVFVPAGPYATCKSSYYDSTLHQISWNSIGPPATCDCGFPYPSH